jgi:hypothetical protein
VLFVTAFRRVPAPIVGTIAIRRDPTFCAFEAALDWLETTGVPVERFDPATAPDEVMKRPNSPNVHPRLEAVVEFEGA